MERLQGTKYSELKNTSSEAFRVTKERKVLKKKKKKKTTTTTTAEYFFGRNPGVQLIYNNIFINRFRT